MGKLLLFFLMMFLFSCENTTCYQCEITAATQLGGKMPPGAITTITLERCGLSMKEIKDFEKENTKTIAFDINDNPYYTGITWSKCKCTKEK